MHILYTLYILHILYLLYILYILNLLCILYILNLLYICKSVIMFPKGQLWVGWEHRALYPLLWLRCKELPKTQKLQFCLPVLSNKDVPAIPCPLSSRPQGLHKDGLQAVRRPPHQDRLRALLPQCPVHCGADNVNILILNCSFDVLSIVQLDHVTREICVCSSFILLIWK